MENLGFISSNLSLRQSELFKEVYSESHEYNEPPTFNDVSINNLDDWYNSILIKYDLSDIAQINSFQAFFVALKYVLATIDPAKLKFEDTIVEEKDLMLWRESSVGISKLTFDEFGQIVYMFNGNQGEKIKGVFDIGVDMEKLLFRFIAK